VEVEVEVMIVQWRQLEVEGDAVEDDLGWMVSEVEERRWVMHSEWLHHLALGCVSDELHSNQLPLMSGVMEQQEVELAVAAACVIQLRPPHSLPVLRGLHLPVSLRASTQRNLDEHHALERYWRWEWRESEMESEGAECRHQTEVEEVEGRRRSGRK